MPQHGLRSSWVDMVQRVRRSFPGGCRCNRRQKPRHGERGQSRSRHGTKNPANDFQSLPQCELGDRPLGEAQAGNGSGPCRPLEHGGGSTRCDSHPCDFRGNRLVNLRDLDKQLEIAKRTAKSREESYNLFHASLPARHDFRDWSCDRSNRSMSGPCHHPLP